ncbi:uncharacterized protein LOC141895453 isoform X3 [Acropora palmata]|uniref:uncharacterized protein LOC141895453 isoform X3 n=1 Tax=Acropora palmata TaxID=6131 RepID=UPI003DA1A097
MGKKRKQAKQTSGSLPSRRQKKRRKVKGKGFNYGAKMTKEAASRVARLNDENTASAEVKSCGTSTIFPRVTSFSRMLLLSSKLGRLSSIKNVFVLVGWLKRMFGCGLQTLGEQFLSEKDLERRRDGENKFEEIVRRMEALEEEVQFLKAENLKMRNNDSCYKGCPNASTLLTHRQGLSEGSRSSIDAPVPQAPPPPPVLAPPPPPLACLKKNQKEKVLHSKENESMPPRTFVTLEDLKKVKLRKVNAAKDKENVLTDSESEITDLRKQSSKAFLKKVVGQKENMPQCVVNLNDIKRITLKRTKSSDNELNTVKLRSPEEMVVMRRNLRKVNVVRSPGGTPLMSDRNDENGTGVTPMMTRALRRKFEARPYSPESPKGRRKSFSPLTDISVNTPSPLSMSTKKLWS